MNPRRVVTLRRGDELITPEESAGLVRVSTRTIRRWIEQGRVQAVRTHPHRGGRLLLRRSDVLAVVGLADAEMAAEAAQ